MFLEFLVTVVEMIDLTRFERTRDAVKVEGIVGISWPCAVDTQILTLHPVQILYTLYATLFSPYAAVQGFARCRAASESMFARQHRW